MADITTIRVILPVPQVIRIDTGQDDGSSGATEFIELTDVPNSYAGEAAQIVRVNAGETGLEFATPSGGGNVSNSGTPTVGQMAQWTNATTIKGVTVSGSGATISINTSGVLAISSIPNATLQNSAITIAGTSTSLGGTISRDTITGLSTTGIIKRTGANTLDIAVAQTDYWDTTTFAGDGTIGLVTDPGPVEASLRFFAEDGNWYDVEGGGGAPIDAHYVTTQTESSLSNEFNLGNLTTGLLKHTVSGSISTPATATAGTDYTDNAFKTIAVSGQNDVVAESAADTLTLVAGTNVTITTDAATDSITITGATQAPTTAHYVTTQAESGLSNEFNLGSLTTGLLKHSVSVGVSTPATAAAGTDYTDLAFKTISVSGQSDIVADSAADTLTVAAGSNITVTTNAGTDTLTIAATGGGNVSASGTPTVGQMAQWTNATTIKGVTISGSGATISVDTSGVVTISGIANASLSNSAITIAGTSTALGGTITLDTITGVSSNGLIKRTGANALTNVAAPSGAVVGDTDTQTLTNKRINPRVDSSTAANSATWAPNADTTDIFELAGALSVAVTTISNPSGTPVDGQKLIIKVLSDSSAHALTWSGSQWRASSDLALPTTTTLSKTIYLGFMYNSTGPKWDLLAKLDNF